MIVSDTAKVLFVHVQKTGGISVERVLLDNVPGAHNLQGLRGSEHATLSTALAARPELADYWTFGFVRNPWARMFSWYAMVRRREALADNGHQQTARRIELNKFWSGVLESCPTFESFVLEGPDLFSRLRRAQVDYLSSAGRRADFIGRTESLDADLAIVHDELGLPRPLIVPRANAAPPTDYRSAFTSEMRGRVGGLFAADIEAFGYEF